MAPKLSKEAQTQPVELNPSADGKISYKFTLKYGDNNIEIDIREGEVFFLNTESQWVQASGPNNLQRVAEKLTKEFCADKDWKVVVRDEEVVLVEDKRLQVDGLNPEDKDLYAYLNPSAHGEINYNFVRGTGSSKEMIAIENGKASHYETSDGTTYEISDNFRQSIAEELSRKFCTGKDWEVVVQDELLVLAQRRKERADSPGALAVASGVESARRGLEKVGALAVKVTPKWLLENSKEPTTGSRETPEIKTRRLAKDKMIQGFLRVHDAASESGEILINSVEDMLGRGITEEGVRRKIRAKIAQEIADTNTIPRTRGENLEITADEVLSYIFAQIRQPGKSAEMKEIEKDVVTEEERRTIRKTVMRFLNARDAIEPTSLLDTVKSEMAKGHNEARIRRTMAADIARTIADLNVDAPVGSEKRLNITPDNVLDYIFEQINGRAEETTINRKKARNPFAEESAWDAILIENDAVRLTRKRLHDGVNHPTIEQELRAILGDTPRREQLIDYAFHQASDTKFRKKSARKFAEDCGLGVRVKEWRAAGDLDDDIKIKLKNEIGVDDKAPEEVDEIIEAAFETSVTKKDKIKDLAGRAWESAKGNTPPDAFGKKIVETRENAWEWTKKNAKVVAGATVAGGAAIVGGAAFLAFKLLGLGVKGVKAAWPYVRETVKQVITKGPAVVGQVLKTAFNVVVKSPVRIVYRPALRLWQTAKAAVNVVHKPKKRVGKGFFGTPWKILRNTTFGGLYRLGQVATLATALALSPVTAAAGALEGGANAVAVDLIGLDHGISGPIDKFVDKLMPKSGTSAVSTSATHGTH